MVYAKRICPIGDCPQSISSKPDAYACTNKDNSMLRQETSGGVFGVIATHVLDMGGIVYGCAYVGHLQATHIRVENKNLLPSLFGSKYVQSNTCDTFKECEKDLKKRKICFIFWNALSNRRAEKIFTKRVLQPTDYRYYLSWSSFAKLF